MLYSLLFGHQLLYLVNYVSLIKTNEYSCKKLYYFIDKHQLNYLPEDWDFQNKWPQYIHRAERDLANNKLLFA